MRTKARRWIGVDGEGIDRGPHRYVLLACSDGDYVEDRNGLSTADCLDFLLDLGTRDARLCGYYLSYDWTKMLWQLSEDAIYQLFRPELRVRMSGAFARVEYEGYKLHWLAGAMWISDDRNRRVTVWDLGKYYQGPFVDALKDWKVRPDVQDRIARMKKRRNAFTWKEIDAIRDYCFEECEALAEFATKLEQAHLDADLQPRGWFGPGSTASVLLKRHNIHERKGVTPPPLIAPIACAFFGGRAEISRSGFIPGPIEGYDISSAYPAHAADLPCLEHGRWERVNRERSIKGRTVAHALVYGTIDNAPGAWCPLPVRLDDATIVFPRTGARGWWWREEWLAAREGWGKGIVFDHAYVLRKECNCKPFAFLPQVFDRRRQIGKESGEGKVLKLSMNSVYGKLAQTIGGAQYANRAWAGMITSATRAQVLRLMLRHEKLENILMIATDGLFSRETHDVDHMTDLKGVERGGVVLGGWERKAHASITLVRPGIYWLGESKLRARGLGRDSLDVAKVQLSEALACGIEEVRLADRTAFGGAKQCVGMPPGGELKRSVHYGEWHPIPTNVSLAPGPKRAADWSPHTLCDVESGAYGVRTTRLQGEFYEFLELIRDLMH